jgi:hypothetical protein
MAWSSAAHLATAPSGRSLAGSSSATAAPSGGSAAGSSSAPAWLEVEFDGNRIHMLDDPRCSVPSVHLVEFMVKRYTEGSNSMKIGLIAFLASSWPQLWTEARFQMAMEIKVIKDNIHLADMQVEFHEDEMEQMPRGRRRRAVSAWLGGVKNDQLKDKTRLKMYSGTFQEVSKAQAEQRSKDCIAKCDSLFVDSD